MLRRSVTAFLLAALPAGTAGAEMLVIEGYNGRYVQQGMKTSDPVYFTRTAVLTGPCQHDAHLSARHIFAADFNGDGVEDPLIVLGGPEAFCDGVYGHTFCGSAGCSTYVWVSGRDGLWTLLFRGNMRDFEIVPGVAGDDLLIDHHGGFCLGPGSMECKLRLTYADGAFVWADDQHPSMAVRLAERAARDGEVTP